MSLWLCIRLPNLPLECLCRQPAIADTCPIVVLERQRVVASNDLAYTAGVRPGQSGGTVRALLNSDDLQIIERDSTRENATLQQLQSWAYSLTPTLECWNNDSLQLEIGRCLKLHGSIEALISRIRQGFAQRGFSIELGLANTRSAAWLLSHSDSEQALCIDQAVADRLAPLPITLIPSKGDPGFPKIASKLQRAGIHTFGDLRGLPGAALARRCGKSFADWIGSLHQVNDEVTQDFEQPPSFQDSLWFGFEIRNRAELHPAMNRLLTDFCQFLHNVQRTALEIEWQLLRVTAEPDCFSVRSSVPHDNANRWFELSCLQLESLTLTGDIEGLALEVRQLLDALPLTDDLFLEQHLAEPMHNLLDRLRSRLGLRAVNQITLRDAHLPEHSQYMVEAAPDQRTLCTWRAQRPFWLLTEPQPVHQDGQQLFWNGPLTLVYGPERIEDNWWQRPVSRDYHIARNSAGQPLWLFQDRHSQRWYVHGVLP